MNHPRLGDRVRDCPVDGCTTHASPWHIAEHMHRQHYSCRCGWVGVSHRQHIAQLRRHGVSTDGCSDIPLMIRPTYGPNRPTSADADAWLKIHLTPLQLAVVHMKETR